MTSLLHTPSLSTVIAAEQTHLQIPSQPEWIAPTVEYLTDKAVQCGACSKSRARKLTLALHEALTNSVIHGNLEVPSAWKERADNAFAELLAARSADPHYGSRSVDIRIDYDGTRCRWTFTDQGKGFDVAGALARAEQNNTDGPLASGRGILLMHAFLDEVHYEAGGRRVVLTLRRTLGDTKHRPDRLPVQRAIASLVERLGTEGVPHDTRRVHPRAAYTARIDIESRTGGAPRVGFARNLSRGGIAFLTTEPLPPEDVILTLPQPDGETLRVVAQIMRCHPLTAGIYDVGARFVDMPGG